MVAAFSAQFGEEDGIGCSLMAFAITENIRQTEVLTMAEYKICFSVAGAFGAQISFEAKPGVTYEDAAASIDKEKLVRLMCLDTLGYSAKDIEVITPEQYEAEFGGDEDG